MLGPRATDRTSSRGRRRVVTDHFEWVRLVNCALSLTTAAAFYLFAVDTWERHGGGVRLLRLAVAGLLLVGVYGSAEQYVQHAPLGLRTVLWPLACLAVLAGLWRARRDEPRH